jgi:hypothetical protein
MLDPDVVLNCVLASLRSIPELVAELGGPSIPATQSITGHMFYSGEENSLERALSQMVAPSVMVAYLNVLPGNFNAETCFKHRLNVYWRTRNKATDPVTGHVSASAGHMWWMLFNLPISDPESAPNIRYVELVNANLSLMEQPPMLFQRDELGQDFFYSTMVFPEKGDVGPNQLDATC